ncbi:hypothetical protein GCM10007041_26790 [Butyricimonas faecihominis]|jgi:membrane protein|nr:hypothetical protein Bfae18676_14810 [Butyricimonas faecihominis]GGJ36358.1 hypothetical protein GCM10007041_26790 [Butyricimonas faecihominis]
MGWDKLLVYTLLVVNVLVMYYVRNMQVPMLMFIFMFTYNVHYLYNWAGIQLSPYEQFQSMEYYGISAMLNLLVFAGVILVVRLNGNKTRERTTFSFLKEKEKSFVWFWVCVAVCILILYYLQRQGTNLLFAEGDLYDLYRENLESISGFAVYFYIFFFLLFIYRPSPIYNIVIGFILAWYLLFALSRGTRMLMVPPVLIFFFYFFENKFKSSWIIIFSTIGLFLLRIIDRFKNNLPLLGGNEERGDILINNQSELLYGGNAVIGSVREIFISVVDRIELLGGYLITCILPPSLVPENMKYPHYLGTIHVDFGGGGIIVFAFYVILGMIGPFLLGMYLGGTINYVYESRRPNYYVMLFFVLSFFMITRWYSYDPNLLFRLSFYMLFVFAVFKLITKASYGKTKSVNS